MALKELFFLALTDTLHKNNWCRRTSPRLSSVYTQLKLARSKSNETLEVNVLQKDGIASLAIIKIWTWVFLDQHAAQSIGCEEESKKIYFCIKSKRIKGNGKTRYTWGSRGLLSLDLPLGVSVSWDRPRPTYIHSLISVSWDRPRPIYIYSLMVQ